MADMTAAEPCFAYRAWSMSTFHSYELLERVLDRALVEAPRHRINCIEIKDYCGSWVDLPARYAGYPRLAEADVLHLKEGPRTREQRRERLAFLKRLAGKVKAAGLELQVWHHCFRDWPAEVTQWYPELADAANPALYDFIAGTLRDSFDFFPEIDGVTITALHETPSILRSDGEVSPLDRLRRLYGVFVDVCQERGKRLILRDFIVRKSEFELFEMLLDELPDWVWIETKDVLADWGAKEKPVNPFIFRYARKAKPLVIEFELANNFAGEMEIPWCDPDYLWRRIRLMAELGLQGGVGRLMNTDHISAGTIFDTPNEIMVWAFSRFLVDPGRLLRADDDEWDRSYDQFDMSVWREWADLRFGEAAAPEAIAVCRQTPLLVDLTINHCGAHFILRFNHKDTPENREKFKSHLTHPYQSIPGVVRAIDRAGGDLARAEKAEARRIVDDALARIEAVKDVMPPAGYELLHAGFDRARCLVAIYQAMIDAVVTAMAVDAGAADADGLKRDTDRLRAAGEAAKDAYGERLYEGTPLGALAVAEFIEDMPGRIDEFRRIAEQPFVQQGT